MINSTHCLIFLLPLSIRSHQQWTNSKPFSLTLTPTQRYSHPHTELLLIPYKVMDSTMASAMTLSTPEDQVEGLMKQVAEENGLEVLDKLATATPGTDTVSTLTNEEEDKLSRRHVSTTLPFSLSLSLSLSLLSFLPSCYA